MAENIARHIDVPPSPPGAPGMFRCAAPLLIAKLFIAAGFRNVSESVIPCTLRCGSPEGYWNMLTEVAAPFVSTLNEADASTVAQVKADVIMDMGRRCPTGTVEGSAILITGEK